MEKSNLPQWDGCDDELKNLCVCRMRELYGLEVPQEVNQRLEQELKIIQTNGFSGLFVLCHDMLTNANVYYGDCYFRGTAGNSFVAYLCGLSNTINPLKPHFRCKDGHYCEFVEESGMPSHIALTKKNCPICGKTLIRDGYGLDEVFMFYPDGDREPDLDFNVPYDKRKKIVQALKHMDCLSEVIRAGKSDGDTITPYLTDTLCGYLLIPKGLHIEDFCEVAEDKGERFTLCDYHKLEESFYKLDILGHSATAMLSDLRLFTGVNPLDIDLDDVDIREFFKGETCYSLKGIPECRDSWGQNFIKQYDISTFEKLVKYSGLSHGSDTWLGNACELINQGVASISDVIANRDDVFDYCILHGIDRIESFKIATDVRSGRGITKEKERIMREHEISDWYIDSCNKIKYLFPRAHSISYALLAWRTAYYKIHYTEDFYRAYFGNMALKESVEIAKKGYEKVEDTLDDLYLSEENDDHNMRMIWDLEVADEMYDKGFNVL